MRDRGKELPVSIMKIKAILKRTCPPYVSTSILAAPIIFFAFPGARPTERMRPRTVAWGRAARWAGVGATLKSPGVTSFTLKDGEGGRKRRGGEVKRER